MPTRRAFLLASAAAACATTEPIMPPHTIYELRNYTLRPSQRDVLIELFEREFIESQEAHGTRIVATFRDLDDPDRFIWIRSFADMPARAAALNGFYFGPVWQAHRNDANATLIDSSNVLLLHPVGAALHPSAPRPLVGASAMPRTLIVATIYSLPPNSEGDFAAFFARDAAPELQRRGAESLASFVTERSANNFPRLPVRENETVFATLMRFESLPAYEDHLAAMDSSPIWRERIAPALTPRFVAPPHVLRLQPTARSLLR